jgi:hypothetical protein
MSEQKFFNAVSYVFHPLLIPFYGFILLFSYGSFIAHVLSLELKIALLVIIALLTIFIPAFFVRLLKRKGSVQDLQLSNAKERTIPYLFTILFYGVAYYNLRNDGLPAILAVFMLSAIITLVSVVCINLFYKISAHMVGISALSATAFFLQQKFQVDTAMLFLLIILIAGLIATARLHAHAHTPSQVYTGFLLGFSIQYLTLYCFV